MTSDEKCAILVKSPRKGGDDRRSLKIEQQKKEVQSKKYESIEAKIQPRKKLDNSFEAKSKRS